jgi:hypothetical protein
MLSQSKHNFFCNLLFTSMGLLLLFSCETPSQAGLIQYVDFETGDLSQFGSGVITPYDGIENISIVKSYHRAGRYAAKCYFETGQDRVELTTANGISNSGQYGISNQTNWYGWSMWIPRGISSDRWTILSQWHYHTPNHIVDSLRTVQGSGNSPTRLSLSPQRMLKFALFHQIGSTQKADRVYELGNNLIQYDNWNDFVMQVKWTSQTDGFVNLWVNGKQVLNLTGTSTYFDNPYGPRFKVGAYKGANYKYPGAPFDVYVDEYRHGDRNSSYDEVLPGSGVKASNVFHMPVVLNSNGKLVSEQPQTLQLTR